MKSESSTPWQASSGVRVALYSHDTMGLGHTRRNLLIADALARSELAADVLLISGARHASRFEFPRGVDCVTLPALAKDTDGAYGPRTLRMGLDDVCSLRSATIDATLRAFEPDVFLVDNVPRGALDELVPTLSRLREGARTRCVLGLRDVLDDPAVVAREWRDRDTERTIEDLFDAVWVYGDPTVYDVATACAFPGSVRAKLEYVGYLDARERLRHAIPPEARHAGVVLGTVGGGQDGVRLAEAFVRAEAPRGVDRVLITGPDMPTDALERVLAHASTRPDLTVLGFDPEPTRWLRHASRVVTMGGYNAVTEVLAFETPALIVPRVRPRREQWIRARSLERLGLVDVLHPGRLTPDALSSWLASPPTRSNARGRVDLNGLARIPPRVAALLMNAPNRSMEVSRGWCEPAPLS